MRKTNVALAFYRDPGTAEAVFEELRKRDFFRLASVGKRKDGTLVVKRNRSIFHLFKTIDEGLIAQYQNLVLRDEILVLVQIEPQEVRQVLSILRQVESGHPV